MVQALSRRSNGRTPQSVSRAEHVARLHADHPRLFRDLAAVEQAQADRFLADLALAVERHPVEMRRLLLAVLAAAGRKIG